LAFFSASSNLRVSASSRPFFSCDRLLEEWIRAGRASASRMRAASFSSGLSLRSGHRVTDHTTKVQMRSRGPHRSRGQSHLDLAFELRHVRIF
jgi:hypothetical protein